MVGHLPLEQGIGVRVPDPQFGALRRTTGGSELLHVQQGLERDFVIFFELCLRKIGIYPWR